MFTGENIYREHLGVKCPLSSEFSDDMGHMPDCGRIDVHD
jgi:hypothetical protein